MRKLISIEYITGYPALINLDNVTHVIIGNDANVRTIEIHFVDGKMIDIEFETSEQMYQTMARLEKLYVVEQP